MKTCLGSVNANKFFIVPRINHHYNLNSGLKPVPNSLHVLTSIWGGLCCLDIGFRHIVPPRPGTMINMVTAGYSCLVFSLQMSHP